MAYDLRNDNFTKSFTGGDGESYTLTFKPGYHLDPTTFDFVEFEDNQILPEIKGNASLEDNVPYGLPTARSLTIKINLANFTGDFADVGTQIVKGRSSSTRTVNGRAMYIPNIWMLTNASGSDFAFAQVPSTQDIDISANKAIYTIDLIGIEKAVFEQLPIEDLDLDNLTGTYETSGGNNVANILYDLVYDIGSSNYRKIGEEPNNDQRIYSMADFFAQIKSKAENITDAYIRGLFFTQTVTFNLSDIDSIWTFYEQDVSTNHAKSSTSVDFEDLLICGALLNGDGDYNGGFFSPSHNGLYNYNNVWSFLRQFCEFFMLKAVWGNSTTNPFELNFYKPLDTIGVAEDINEISPKEFNFSRSENYVSQSTSFIVGAGQYDYKNYKVISEYGSLDGNSEDSELMFNNYILKFVDGVSLALAEEKGEDLDKFMGTPAEIRKKSNISERTLYYFKSTIDNRFFKVHEDCALDIGGSNSVINGDTTYTSLTYPDYSGTTPRNLVNYQWFIDLVPVIQSRMPYYGIGYNRVQGAKTILGNENQGVLKAKLSSQISNTGYIDLSKLGEAYTIDLGSVSNVPSLGEFSGKIILTSIEYDFISGEIDCEFFMRGDAGA